MAKAGNRESMAQRPKKPATLRPGLPLLWSYLGRGPVSLHDAAEEGHCEEVVANVARPEHQLAVVVPHLRQVRAQLRVLDDGWFAAALGHHTDAL